MRVVIVAGALLLAASPAAAQRFTFRRDLPVQPNAVVEVNTSNGAVEIIGGAAGSVDVEGTVTVRIGLDVPADAVKLAQAVAGHPPIDATRERVVLAVPADADARRATTVSYVLRVPPLSIVNVRTSSGAVTLRAFPGKATLVTQSAALDVEQAGETTVRTGSGSVRVRGAGPLRVESQSSEIDVAEVRDALEVRTGSGRVRAALAAGAGADIRTQSSAITVTGASAALALESGSGQVEVSGAPTADWQITNGSGRIVVWLSPAASCQLDARSTSGRVKAPGVTGGGSDDRHVVGAFGQGGPTLRLVTRSSAIEVTRR
jgi:DUF4097 and DUF4098 domain-containing protein YvlB